MRFLWESVSLALQVMDFGFRRVLYPAVDAVCRWSGWSNFAVARVLFLFGICLDGIEVGRRLARSSPASALVLVVITALFWSAVTRLYAETRCMERRSGGDTVPLPCAHTWIMVSFRSVFLVAAISSLVRHNGGWGLVCVSLGLYAMLRINGGGKSAWSRLVDRVRGWSFGVRLAPSPA